MFAGTINQSFFTYLSVRSNYFKKILNMPYRDN